RFALPMPDTDRFLRVESQVFGMDASADGAFHAQRLAKGLYVLRVEPWTFNPFATPGDNRIGAVDPGTEVDLSSSSPARVQIGVRRSRPVRVSVEIEIASEWRKENAIPTLWPIARVVADDVLDNGLQVRRTGDSGQGRFQLHIEAALRNPRLELELGPAKAVYPITIPAGADVLPLV